MAEKNIQEGDEVSWKWGTSEPTGTVAEVKTQGKLEIETKGKLVHKNADPSNPAVHVGRTGNDVVKRASELTKLNSSADGDSTETSAPGGKRESPATQEQKDDAGGETEEKERQKSTKKPAPKTRASRKKSNAAATTGEKRAADEAGGDADGAMEEATGKKTKKAKTAHGDASGEKKGPGRPRKDSKAKKGQDEKKHVEDEAMAVEVNAQSHEGTTALKKKGTGRLKRSDVSDHSSTAAAPVDVDAPAANTRSKD